MGICNNDLQQDNIKNESVEDYKKSMKSHIDYSDYHKLVEKMNIIAIGMSEYNKGVQASNKEDLLKLSDLLDDIISEIYK